MPIRLEKRLMPKTRMLAVALLTCLLCATSQAEVRLPSIVGSHMVVQQAVEVPICGWAEPGEEVTVSLKEKVTANRLRSP